MIPTPRPNRIAPTVVAAALLMTTALAHAQTPGAVTTIATTGPVVGEEVTLVWGAVPGADAFVVRLADSAGAVIDVRLTTGDAGCADSSICRATMHLGTLQPGTVQWLVQAVQGGAAGPWSRAQTFVSARLKADGTVSLSGATDPEKRLSETGVNTAVGLAALASGGGSYNTAVGISALEKNTGDSNTAVGVDTLAANTSGTWNTAVGMGAMRRNTTGHQNVAVGGQALVMNQSGTANTAIGIHALSSNLVSNNTAVGGGALRANTIGTDSSALGANALTNNRESSSNTAVGSSALAANVGGAGNSALGANALLSNGGSFNVAVGLSTLFSQTSGHWNTGLGTFAMLRNTTGAVNVAVGAQALSSNTTGEANTVVGANSMIASNGSANTAVGYTTLYNNTTGGSNVAVGYEAGVANTTGGANVALGVWALRRNQTGSNNTAVGHEALTTSYWDAGYLPDPSGSNSTAVGVLAGYTNFEGVDNMVYLANTGPGGGGSFDGRGMRLGAPNGTTSITRTFTAGVRGVTTGLNDAVPVLVASNGQLGTISSSARYKEDIADMGAASSAILRLRPVTFRYRQAFSNGERPLQYGLIAEEVAAVMPSLAVYNDDGTPETVKYHELPVLLLNEVQRLERDTRGHDSRLDTLERQMKEMRAQIDALTAAKR